MKTKKLAIGISIMAFSINAMAGFVHTDWATENDKQVTLDEDTGIEWLKLNNTIGKSMNEVMSDSAYDGWRLPTNDEVESFVKSANTHLEFNDGYTLFSGPSYNTEAFIFSSLLGKTEIKHDRAMSYGLHSNGNGNGTITGALYYYWQTGKNAKILDDNHAVNMNWSREGYSVFLVSDGGTTIDSIENPELNVNNANAPINATVPEPSALALLGLTLLGFASLKRKKSKV